MNKSVKGDALIIENFLRFNPTVGKSSMSIKLCMVPDK